MNPKISIITVCYNSETHVEEAIKSVIEQIYENKEYIVIDGGSKDGTLSIIEKYRDKIDYYVSEPDKGISDAFNKGIKAATGDVIGIINSDDKLEKGALQEIANAYENDVDMYRGICYTWNDQTGYLFEEIPTLYWPAVPISIGAAHPATFVSKKAYERLGVFDIDLRYAMDTDLFRRFSKAKAKVKYVDKPLAYFRLGGVSQSDEKKRLKELLYILKKNGNNSVQNAIFWCIYKFRLFVKHLVMSIGGEDFRFKFRKFFNKSL